MSTATEKPTKTLDRGQRSWLQKMGAALGVSLKSAEEEEPPLTGVFPEIMWEEKRDVVEETDGLVKEMEEAQLSKAPLFRKGITLILRLAEQKKFAEANKAYEELHPKIHTEYDKFQKARGNGVRDLEDDSPKSDEKPAQKGQGGPESPSSAPTTPAAPASAADPNAAQYQKQVLKVGSSGPAVEYLQKTLSATKSSLKADGKFGLGTQTAVKEFQTSKGLKADGIVGPKTWAALAGGAGGDAAAPTPAGGASPAADPAAGASKSAELAGANKAASADAKPAAAPAKGSGGFISASVGKGGKNMPEDVKAVQGGLNKYGGAKLNVDGKYNSQTQKAIEEFQKRLGQFKPDGLIQPNRGPARCLSGAVKIPPTPPEPKPIEPPVLGKASLDKGAFVWHSTRGILDTNIKELKKGVRAAYGTEHADLLKEIDNCMVKLGSVVDKLDTRLADALDNAYKAKSEQARVPELKKAEGIMKEYLKYVKSEPLIGHMDDNPFGVKTSLMKVITDALKHLSQLLPKATGEKS